jgi:AsmA protein
MALPRRTLFIVLGSIVGLILLIALCIPLFLDADSFRTRIESTLTTSLGRKVTLGKLDLSVLSGSLVAENTTLADDPAFSAQPFMTVSKVKIGIEMIPLILSREIHITGFALDSPKINLLRAANGTWNYSTIGSAQKNAPTKDSNSLIPNLTVGHVTITDGQLNIGALPAPGAPAKPSRTYDKLELDAKDFSFQKSFPFTASTNLPAGGTVSLSGNAGPIDAKDASLTPFSAHLVVKHLDPVAAGFVDSTAGVTGTIDAIDVQAVWNGRQLHVANLLVDTPKLTLVRENKPTNVAPPPPAPNSNDMLSTLSADRLQVKDGTLTVTSPGQSIPGVYQKLNAEVTNLSPTASSPFKLSAQIPGGGSLTGDGTVGPINQASTAATPLNAHVAITHLDLATSGIVAPDAGISGIADIDARALSDGKTLSANISSKIQGLRIAKNGSPSAKPVDLQLSVAQNMQSLSGQIQKGVINIGGAIINIAGTYQTTGATTALNLKVSSDGTSIDALEAFLPSVGVHLPSGSRLQGGTLTTSLNVTGTGANPIISGPIRLNNTNLAGFDLGSKLGPLSSLAGIKSGSGTAIQSLSTNINVNGGNVRTDNLSVIVPSIGSAAGAGTISAAGALNYNIVLKLTGIAGAVGKVGGASGAGGIAGQLMGMIPGGAAGGAAGGVVGNIAGSALRNGVPVQIGGTTSNPTFTPNMNGLASSAAGAAVKGAAKPSGSQTDSLTNALGGLLKPH